MLSARHLKKLSIFGKSFGSDEKMRYNGTIKKSFPRAASGDEIVPLDLIS